MLHIKIECAYFCREPAERKAPVHQNHGAPAAFLTFLVVRDSQVLLLRREALFDNAYSENLHWRRLQLSEYHHLPGVYAAFTSTRVQPIFKSTIMNLCGN